MAKPVKLKSDLKKTPASHQRRTHSHTHIHTENQTYWRACLLADLGACLLTQLLTSMLADLHKYMIIRLPTAYPLAYELIWLPRFVRAEHAQLHP